MSLHAPRAPHPRAPHRQFGRGPSLSPLPEGPRPSRSLSPTDCTHHRPHFEIDVLNLHSQSRGRKSPINSSSATSHAHTPLSPPSISRHRRRQSLTDQSPYTIGSPTPPDAPEGRTGSPHHSPTASSPSVTLNLDFPAGRLVQLIHSEQVPRYAKARDVTVQVDYIHITTSKLLSLL